MKPTTWLLRHWRGTALAAAPFAGWCWAAGADEWTGQVGGGAMLVGGLALGGRAAVRRAPWLMPRRQPRRPGLATPVEVWRTSSAWAMRRQARNVCPTLADVSRAELLRTPVSRFGSPLCTVGRQTVHTSVEQSMLLVGIPGTGKSGLLGCRILDAPGAVVVTSTAADLHDLTAPLRAERGPVRAFNPGNIGGVPSNVRWPVLSGCTNPATAQRRATDLMGPPGSGDAARWHNHGRRLFGALLHAAALADLRMRHIQAWLGDPDRAVPVIAACLEESPQRAAMTHEVTSALAINPRTRDGILLAVAPALEWLTSPAAAGCGDPDDPDEDRFDLETFLDATGTLYLLGDDDGLLAPLVGALTAEIAYQARAVASRRLGGRLDPALRMVLDEVALICPVPLPRWMSELRKRSIGIDAACQGLGQLRERWGKDGAGTIINSASAVVMYGGTKDDDLDMFCRLTEREGKPAITPAELFCLPEFHALLIRRGMRPALARTPKAWDRRDVRRANRKPSSRRTVLTKRKEP